MTQRKTPTRKKNPDDPAWVEAWTEHADGADHTCAKCGEVGFSSLNDVAVPSGDDAEMSEERWCNDCYKDTCACRRCGVRFPEDLATEVLDSGRERKWCPACVHEHTTPCQHCEGVTDTEETVEVVTSNNRPQTTESWCSSCGDDDTFTCHHCDVQFSDSLDQQEVEGDTWCYRCTENAASYCDRHEEWYNGYCGSCEHDPEPDDDDEDSALVHDYHYCSKRGFEPIESPWVEAQPKPLYFGLELEVEVPSGKPIDNYAQVVDDTMGVLLAGMERDGSITHGFEIITQPAGLDTHRKIWPGVKLSGLKSHNTTTCGLHIHITRDAFSKMTLGKMMQFTYAEHNQAFMETFARRAFVGYAKRIEGMKIVQGTKRRPERYEAWNTTNDATVEFRLPRGTTKITTILATLEFVYALIRFCEATSANTLLLEFFKHMISSDAWLLETRFLRAYMVDRGLASAKEMRLPKLKPDLTPQPEDATAERENPASRGPRSYAEAALLEYEQTGEDGTIDGDGTSMVVGRGY